MFVCRFFTHTMHTLHSNPANCWYLKATTFVVYQNQTLDQTINHIFDTWLRVRDSWLAAYMPEKIIDYLINLLRCCCCCVWLVSDEHDNLNFTKKNQKTIANHGCLGNRNDEGRSELRYVMWIADFRESSNPWTHMALPLWVVCLSERLYPPLVCHGVVVE